MTNIYLINFFLAISTTIGMTTIPLLSVDIVGISIFLFALLEGVGEFLSNIIRMISGYLFDKAKNKKSIFILATILAFFSKILLIVPSIYSLITTKLLERFSNGFFAAPRDAFVGSNSSKKGLSLGLLNSFRAAGCVVGAIITSIYLSKNINLDTVKNLIIFASSLCLISISLSFFITVHKINKTIEKQDISFFDVLKEQKTIFVIVFLFFCARFNDGMIILFLKSKEISPWFYLSTIGIFNSISFLTSPILGAILDTKYKKISVYITFISLILFNIIFIMSNILTIYIAFIALIFWGIQRVGSQICFTNLLFNNISKERYGTACGIMNIFTGFGTLIASMICGYLSNHLSYTYIFIYSMILSIISLLFFLKLNKLIIKE